MKCTWEHASLNEIDEMQHFENPIYRLHLVRSELDFGAILSGEAQSFPSRRIADCGPRVRAEAHEWRSNASAKLTQKAACGGSIGSGSATHRRRSTYSKLRSLVVFMVPGK
jgi:hypothetical protein